MKQRIFEAKFEAGLVFFYDDDIQIWHTLEDMNTLGWTMVTNVGSIVTADTEILKYVALFENKRT